MDSPDDGAFRLWRGAAALASMRIIDKKPTASRQVVDRAKKSCNAISYQVAIARGCKDDRHSREYRFRRRKNPTFACGKGLPRPSEPREPYSEAIVSAWSATEAFGRPQTGRGFTPKNSFVVFAWGSSCHLLARIFPGERR